MGNLLDYKGKVFSFLTVIDRAGTDKNGHVLWFCECICKNVTIVSGSNLRTEHTKSCGCLNPASSQYKNYGKRGISICEKWKKFEGFFEDMGERPEGGYTLERKDNALGYFKDNCKWATQKEQALNRRNNIYVDTFLGRMTISQIAEYTGVRFGTIRSRIVANWPADKLFSPTIKNS